MKCIDYKSELRGQGALTGVVSILFPLGRDSILSMRVKAKVDHLNLVFVILNLVLGAGKLSA